MLRLTAPNPSLMTGPGTNSYLVGRKELVVIDPGPDDEAHVSAILDAAAARRGNVRGVLVTHTHPDHSPGAESLGKRAGAPLVGWSERDGFRPDRSAGDGDLIELGDMAITALHTPGHASNHLCYLIETGTGEPGAMLRVLFSGDHIMGGSSVVVAPPDGDMRAYLGSLDKLSELAPPLDAIAPGHGPLLTKPAEVISGYRSHRLEREAAVAASLSRRQSALIDEIVADVYTDVPLALHPVARYSVWAHLRKLGEDGQASCDDPGEISAPWSVSL